MSEPIRTAAPARRPGAERLSQQLLWLVGLRLVVVTSVLLPAFLIDLFSEGGNVSFEVLLHTAGIAYTSSLVYLALRVLRVRPLVEAYTQFTGDLVLVSYLVALTGGATSPFSTLYLIVITVAASLLRRRAGVQVATAAWLAFAALAVGHAQGWLFGVPREGLPASRLASTLLIHLLGFYAVAFLTSLLAREASLAERQLEEASEDLAELETVHRYVVSSISSGLITTDMDGRITSVNPAARTILETEEEALVGRLIYETRLLSESIWSQHTALDMNERQRDEVELESDDPDSLRLVGFSIADLRDHEGRPRGYTVVFQDLTPWRRLQEQVRISDRMAAVGEMAAGLAHEIGNPLAAISGSVQMLSNLPGRTAAENRLLRIVLQESQRLDRTIKDFLAYARPAPRRLTSFDIAALLSEHEQILRNSKEVGARHEVVLDLDRPEVVLRGDRDRLQQVLWNLSRNALRAMSDGGSLRLVGRCEGLLYSIRVEDTGRGMTEEQKRRLFQPYQSFFDGGTGIGMAIVYRIVEEHEGRIRVDSGPGGTTITVELPLAGPTDPADAPRSALPPSLRETAAGESRPAGAEATPRAVGVPPL